MVLFIPVKKEIWYDETVSMLCSKGITHDMQYYLRNTDTASSAMLARYNNAPDVFNATVNDNANSYLYNIGLHWFTWLCGNSLQAYMLFSKLISVITLIAFFSLCGLILGESLFSSAAILLLATDTNFYGMSHEIRTYAMGMMFVTLAAIYFFRFIKERGKPVDLFFLGLFSVATVLSHFLSVYIILCFLGGIVYFKRASLFSSKNIAAMVLPVTLIVLFFLLAYPGLSYMSRQNHAIQQKTINEGFSIAEVCIRSVKFFALNFKAVFPAYVNKFVISVVSAFAVIGLYIASFRSAKDKTAKAHLTLLFIMGVSSSFFLSLLCLKSHHYTALYFRYFSFCAPFCCLFVAYAVQILAGTRLNMAVKGGIIGIATLPAILLFVIGIRNAAPIVHYNHVGIAQAIKKENIHKLGVQRWKDAFLVQSMLPNDYKIDYVRNENAPYFTLYYGNTEQHIPVIRIEGE